MTAKTWKEALQGVVPEDLAREVNIFEGQVELRKQKKIDEKVFAETRLRRGTYGQRYDNGQRNDGNATRELDFPTDLTKGPNTEWDAPGMQRIKVPFGGLNPDQMDVLAQLADEYSDGILHVTTRQDFQLHYVHIEDTPDLMRRLASVGITTLEACGNSVRNVTGCPLSGVCHDEAFDVTPYAKAMTYFLLGHDDAQDFGRKFKISFSGCVQHACALANMHDLGLIAKVQNVDGVQKRGFTMVVGGGLGAVPYQAKVLSDFVPEEEILPTAQAIARVFARLGEKKNRNRARVKFLVDQLGIEEFRRLVEEERKILPPDSRWTSYLNSLDEYKETAIKPATHLNGVEKPAGFEEWYQTNVYRQRQTGYSLVTVNLPLGDLTTKQMFQLADIARKYAGDSIRTTVEQNIVLRWISDADLPGIYQDLMAINLGDAGAGTIVDITSCPGTDTCKLGIASSRGLARELRTQLAAKSATLPDAIKDLKIKVSGCFNSCGQHHIADIGFYGNSRRSGNYKVPHFQVVLGGQWRENAGAYGLAIGAVPSKAVPQVVDVLTTRFVNERERGESFQDWIKRLGKKEVHAMLEPFMKIPVYEEDPNFYKDWGDVREFTLGDIGVGECAGEVVSLFSMEVTRAESEVFEAQLALEAGDYKKADAKAYRAMLLGARALIRGQYPNVGDDPQRIVDEFRTRFYDTKLFFGQFSGNQIPHYFFNRHENPVENPSADYAHRLVEEAQLFIEGCHACDEKLTTSATTIG